MAEYFTVQKTKSKKFFPPSLERKLTYSQTDRGKEVDKKGKRGVCQMV